MNKIIYQTFRLGAQWSDDNHLKITIYKYESIIFTFAVAMFLYVIFIYTGFYE